MLSVSVEEENMDNTLQTPGAEDPFVTKFNTLFQNQQYQEAAELAASAPKVFSALYFLL